jgi:hypothetical protein
MDDATSPNTLSFRDGKSAAALFEKDLSSRTSVIRLPQACRSRFAYIFRREVGATTSLSAFALEIIYSHERRTTQQ